MTKKQTKNLIVLAILAVVVYHGYKMYSQKGS